MKKTQAILVLLCLVTVFSTVITSCASKTEYKAEQKRRETFEPVTVEPGVVGFECQKITTKTHNELYDRYGLTMVPQSDKDVEKLLNGLISYSQVLSDDMYEPPALYFTITFEEGTKAKDLDLEYMNSSHISTYQEKGSAFVSSVCLTVKVRDISAEALRKLSADPCVLGIEIDGPVLASPDQA